MNEKVLRCAIYIRVSTAEQAMHGKSLGAQLDFLTTYAEEHGMKVVGVYADEGKSARKNLRYRKEIKRLLQSVERDEVDIILFWKLVRWEIIESYDPEQDGEDCACDWDLPSEVKEQGEYNVETGRYY